MMKKRGRGRPESGNVSLSMRLSETTLAWLRECAASEVPPSNPSRVAAVLLERAAYSARKPQ